MWLNDHQESSQKSAGGEFAGDFGKDSVRRGYHVETTQLTSLKRLNDLYPDTSQSSGRRLVPVKPNT